MKETTSGVVVLECGLRAMAPEFRGSDVEATSDRGTVALMNAGNEKKTLPVGRDGVTIQRFPVRFLTAALFLSGLSCLWLAWNAYRSHHFEQARVQRRLRYEQLRGEILRLDEVLTMSARMAAASGEGRWESRYRHFEPELDAAIKELERLEQDRPEVLAAARETDRANVELVQMEHHAFDLVRAGQLDSAREVLFSPAYEAQKQRYAEGIGRVLQLVDQQMRLTARQTRQNQRYSLAGALLAVAVAAVIWVFAVFRLGRWRRALLAEMRERQKAEARYRDLVETAQDLIWQCDAEGRFTYLNPAWEEVFGCDLTELLGRKLTELAPETAGKHRRQDLAQLLQNEIVKGLETVLQTDDGRPVHLVFNARVHRDEQGNRVRVRGTAYDITRRRQAEEELRILHEISHVFLTAARNELYVEVLAVIQRALDSGNGLFTYLDQDGNLVHAACDREVLRECEMEEKSILFAKDGFPGIFKRAIAEKTICCRNDAMTVPPGHIAIQRILCAPIVNGDAVIGLIAVANRETAYTEQDQALLATIAGHLAPILQARLDIEREQRERQKIEEQFHQAQKLESVGRLAGGVAHDFNNMLNVIIGHAEILQGKLSPDDPLREGLQQIIEAGNRSAALTRQLLAFSRKQALQPQPTDLNGLVVNLQKMLRRLIGEDIELKLALAADLEPAFVDPGQIEQVIMNLAVNARDAMPRGGTLMIETSVAELDDVYAANHPGATPGNYLLLAVSDTGCGMDQETLDRIFEPFFTTKDKERGTGLGLSTVYGIVKQTGGHIWCYSEPGAGATFKVYLPIADEDAEPAPAASSRPPIATAGNAKILVVEDEESLRNLIDDVLSQLGYETTLAANGPEALHLLETSEWRPNLVITDVVMPDMNGRELVERLRRQYPDLAALYISGYTDNVIVHQGILDRDTPFLQKPFAIAQLAEKVKAVLKGTFGDGEPE